MAGTDRLKMPDEYTELSYEDGELSGSGTKRWTSEDTWTVAKWAGIVIGAAGIVVVGHRLWTGNWFWQGCGAEHHDEESDEEPDYRNIEDTSYLPNPKATNFVTMNLGEIHKGEQYLRPEIPLTLSDMVSEQYLRTGIPLTLSDMVFEIRSTINEFNSRYPHEKEQELIIASNLDSLLRLGADQETVRQLNPEIFERHFNHRSYRGEKVLLHIPQPPHAHSGVE